MSYIHPLITDPGNTKGQGFKYLTIISMVWMACLLLTTIPGAKLFPFMGTEFSVGIIIYPITYIFADIFTEVYGYKQTRKIVWTGLSLIGISSIILQAMVAIPPSHHYGDQDSFAKIFTSTPAIAFATMAALFTGEFINSYVIAKMKIIFQGKMLWARAILSSILGQLADNTIFFIGAFGLTGVLAPNDILKIIIINTIFCTAYEFLALPITYKLCAFLKLAEGIDIFDTNTNFNPFSWEERVTKNGS